MIYKLFSFDDINAKHSRALVRERQMNNVLGTISANLIKLFDNIMEVEVYIMQRDYGNKISMTEVHTIAAIGTAELKSMSELAAQLNITVGTLTVGINNLVKKGFVERYKTERDRRIVKVALTKEGKKIYMLHEKFHNDVVFALVKGLNESEMEVVAKALHNLDSFVEKHFENGEKK